MLSFKTKKHKVRLYAGHEGFQEIIVERKRLSFLEFWQKFFASLVEFVSGSVLPVVKKLLEFTFFVCFGVGSILVTLVSRIKNGAHQEKTKNRSSIKLKTGVILTSLNNEIRAKEKHNSGNFEFVQVIYKSRYAFTVSLFLLFLFSGSLFFKAALLVTQGLETKSNVLGAADSGLKDLEEAQKMLRQQNPELAAQKFSQAVSSFEKSQKELEETGVILGGVLAVLPQKQAANNLLDAVKLIGNSGVVLSQLALEFSKVKITAAGIDGIEAGGFLNRVHSLIVKANSLVVAASENIDLVDENLLPLEKKEAFLAAKSRVKLLSKSLGSMERVVKLLSMLFSGKKHVLVVFQNNNEIRATGGFMGTYGAMEFLNGKISEIHVSSIYDLDGQLKENIAPPHPLRLLSGRWFLRDSNWFFDFAESSEVISSFYEKEGGETPDVVLAMTPNLIVDLLGVTGPIMLPKYGVTLTADNFVETVQIQTSTQYDKEENKPKQLLADFMPAFLQKLGSVPDNQKVLLVEKLQKNLTEKQILLYARDPKTQALIKEFNWGGVVGGTDRDYLAVVNSNVSGTKTDLAINQSLELETSIEKDGSVINSLTIEKGNSLPDEPGLTNTSFMRIFVPEGSELISAEGFTEKVVPTVNTELLKNHPKILVWEKSLSKNVLTGMVTGKEAGKTFFANWLLVPGGSKKTVKLKYKLPFKITDTDHYSILMQKQPGASNIHVVHTVNFPFYSLRWSNVKNSKSKEHESVNEFNLNKDVLFGYVLEK